MRTPWLSRWMSNCALAVLLGSCQMTCSASSTQPGAQSVAQDKVAGPFITKPTETNMPPAPEEIQRSTPVFYVAWSSQLAANEQVTGALIAVDSGGAAPPNTKVVQSSFTAQQAGPNWGVMNFSMPTAGWPAGHYRVDITKAAGAVGSVEFDIR